MTDITMCQDDRCPFKGNCLRFNATPNPYHQSFFAESPLLPAEGYCPDYWAIHDYEVPTHGSSENKLVEFATKVSDLIVDYQLDRQDLAAVREILDNWNIWQQINANKTKKQKKPRVTKKSKGPSVCAIKPAPKVLSLNEVCTS